jgi:hypothetical protein
MRTAPLPNCLPWRRGTGGATGDGGCPMYVWRWGALDLDRSDRDRATQIGRVLYGANVHSWAPSAGWCTQRPTSHSSHEREKIHAWSDKRPRPHATTPVLSVKPARPPSTLSSRLDRTRTSVRTYIPEKSCDPRGAHISPAWPPINAVTHTRYRSHAYHCKLNIQSADGRRLVTVP